MLSITKSEISYYDQSSVWDKYKDNPEEVRRAASTVGMIPEDVETVLDIGCGNGIVTNMVNKSLVVGIDFARTPLRNLKTHAIQGSVNFLPIKPNKFDLILLTEVLEHLDEKTYAETIAEIKRLNAKYILVTVPYKENIEANFCKCSKCGNLFNLSHHRLKFDERKISEAFPDYMIKSVKYESYRIIPNKYLFKLKHKFGVYHYSEVALCDKCGSRPVRPHWIWRYVFGIPNQIDRLFKRMLGLKKPYHLLILMERS